MQQLDENLDAPELPGLDPRERRLNFFLLVDVRRHDGYSLQARLRNLSAGGLRAEAQHRLREGDEVTIRLRQIGQIDGNVAWVSSKAFGIAFREPVDPRCLLKEAPPATARPRQPYPR